MLAKNLKTLSSEDFLVSKKKGESYNLTCNDKIFIFL